MSTLTPGRPALRRRTGCSAHRPRLPARTRRDRRGKSGSGCARKHRAAFKALRSISMPVGIACPVCGHLTMTIPMSPPWKFVFLFSLAEKYRPVGVASCRCGLLGGHRAPCLIEHRAVGLMLCLLPTAGSLLKRTLELERAFLPARSRTLLKCFPISSPASVAFSVTFTSLSLTARLSSSSERIPRDARQRHENSRSVFDRILGEP